MPGFKRSVSIERPVEEVFDFATNLDNAPRMMPGVTKIEMVTEGGMKTGAKFRETRIVDGKERTAVIEVIEHQRPTVHAACAAMMGMRGIYRFRFYPEGTGTRVEMEAEVQGNLLWKMFLSTISQVMETQDGEYLQRMKAAILSLPPRTC